MREYVVNRPDAGAMRTLLERESDPEGLIVRLAWLAGSSGMRCRAVLGTGFLMDELAGTAGPDPSHGGRTRSYLWRLYKTGKVRVPTWWFPNGMGTGCSPSPSPAGPAGAGPERAERCAADGSAPRLDHSPA